jgi:putative transposase
MPGLDTGDVPGAVHRARQTSDRGALSETEAAMRPSRFTEDQIVQALRRVRAGTPAVQVCRELGITQTTFYRWRQKYEHAPAGEVRGVRELRVENRKLKEMVVDLLLDKQNPTSSHGR